MYANQKENKLYLETVKLRQGSYSITPECGDLYDIEFFCKILGLSRVDLAQLLNKSGISFCFVSNVLCFETEKLAQKAIDEIHAALSQGANRYTVSPVA